MHDLVSVRVAESQTQSQFVTSAYLILPRIYDSDNAETIQRYLVVVKHYCSRYYDAK